jgi:hypothetical protein
MSQSMSALPCVPGQWARLYPGEDASLIDLLLLSKLMVPEMLTPTVVFSPFL